MQKQHVEIVTPDDVYFSGETYFITVPGVNGSLGILPGHDAIVSPLVKGEIVLADSINSKDSNAKRFNIDAGYIKVSSSKVIILAEKIEKIN